MTEVGTEGSVPAATPALAPAAVAPPPAAQPAVAVEKPSLIPQMSVHDMSDIPTPTGMAKREVTKFTNTWNNVCKNSMVGLGEELQGGAIVSHTGTIYSSTPDDFLPTIDQVNKLVEAMNNPGKLAMVGISVGCEHYAYKDCQVSGSSAHCFTGKREDGNGGILIYFTRHTILIGIYFGEGEAPRDKAISHIENIWEWVRETGF